jgi:hypothetical protein
MRCQISSSSSPYCPGFGIFSDILPGSIADVVGVNPPNVKTFQGGLPAFLRIPAGESDNVSFSRCHHRRARWNTSCALFHGVEFGLEHQLGNTGSVHAQYVGTRAINQPYLTQVNGYQTVCQGCFAPFLYE